MCSAPVSTWKYSESYFLTFSTRLHDFFCCDNNARSNNDNDNDNNNNINTNNNNTAATTTTLSSVATSVAKQPKSKRLFTKDRHQSAMIHFMDHKHKRSKPNFYAKNYLLYGSEDADPDMMRLT